MKLSDKGIIIRKTIEEDLSQIYSAGKDYDALANLPFAFTAENLADIFASDISICYTAARKKKVLGFIACSIKDNQSTLRWIMVSKNFRRTGIGKVLLNRCIEESEKCGVNSFLIEILDSNDSTKFFIDSGFTLKETVLKFIL